MCNINILIRKNIEKDKGKVCGFLMETTLNSFSRNPDGEGFYCSDGNLLIKRKNKINLFKYRKNLKKSNIIITHQRLSTSGHEIEYNHPFRSKEFILVHNGIINDFLGKNGSDTYGFFKRFVKIFDKLEGKREEKIIYSIKELLDNLKFGSFSIALLDKTTNNLYYFKNENTSINFLKSKSFLFVTTLYENKYFLDRFDENFKETKIEDHLIYRINENLNIDVVGKIKRCKKQYYYQNIFIIPKREEINQREILIGEYGVCGHCGQDTCNLDAESFEKICDECLYWEKENKSRIPSYV